MWHPKQSQFIWMSLQIEIFFRLEFILSEIETHLILWQFYKHTHINMQDLTYQFQMCELIHFRFSKNLHFTTVLGVRRSLFALRVARRAQEFAFHHSFGRPTIAFCVKGRSASSRICISPQFWASDEHEVTRGLSPAATYQTYPAEKKRRNFKEEQHFRRAAVSAALLSRFSQQPFSAALLSSSSQQLFSAAFLSSSSQQLFSADFLSSLSQQLFSAALLSSFSQQLFSAALLSSLSQQLFSAALFSSLSQQLFSAALLSYHLAVVRGWWSASNIIFSSSSQQLFSAIILLWSGVGGQLGTSSCCGQGLVVKYATVL